MVRTLSQLPTLPLLLSVCMVPLACSDNGDSGNSANGGTNTVGSGGTGGIGVATGGLGSGGAPVGGFGTGGMVTGGFPTGGAALGGFATGGLATGGLATGGLATGGLATGGLATGGLATGGAAGTGGITETGGFGGGPTGGAAGVGGSTGGVGPTGGSGGSSETGGTDTGGSATGGSGGSTNGGTPPADVANASGVTVVAAHSMTRALFAGYSGKLFQVTRFSDGATQDISVTSTGGTVDLATLDSFCTSEGACGISVLYDQTSNANDLRQTLQRKMPTVAIWTSQGGSRLPYSLSQASGDDGGIPGGGGQFLRNRLDTRNIPTGSSPTTEYMVVFAKYYRGHCCWDYGNMEATSYGFEGIGNDGAGTMFALYFGETRDWTWGAGSGPWGMIDMEIGVFSGGQSNGSGNDADPSFTYPATNVVGILGKTNGTSDFTLKVGDMEATSTWTEPYSGPLPWGYAPLRLQGGLSLGEGGDGSNNVDGAFFEGFVVAGEESDETDNSISANLHDYFTR